MKRREFLQNLSAVGASALLPCHASAGTSPSISQTQRPSEDAAAGRVAVVAIGSAGVAVLSALSGKLLYLKRSIAISTDPVTLLRAAADEKLMFGLHAVSQFPKGFRRDFEDTLERIDIAFVIVGRGDSADSEPAEVIADVLRAKSIPAIAAVIPAIGSEDECREELIPDHLRALKDVSKTAFQLTTAARISGKPPHRWCSTPNRAADAFDRLYHGVVKPVFGEGLITLDLEDVVSILSQNGASAFGVGTASGEHAVETATLRAITSSSLGRRRLFSASAVFVHLDGHPDLLRFKTVAAMMRIVGRATDEHYDCLLLPSATEANTLPQNCQVTILASGVHEL